MKPIFFLLGATILAGCGSDPEPVPQQSAASALDQAQKLMPAPAPAASQKGGVAAALDAARQSQALVNAMPSRLQGETDADFDKRMLAYTSKLQTGK